MIPYRSPIVDLYLNQLIPWEEFYTLRAGPDADVDAERETLATVLETAAQICSVPSEPPRLRTSAPQPEHRVEWGRPA